MAQQASNGVGIASLILGIFTIIFSWLPIIGIITGILGIILAAAQRKKHNNGIATGGMITSIIGLIFSIISNILWLFFGALLAASL